MILSSQTRQEPVKPVMAVRQTPHQCLNCLTHRDPRRLESRSIATATAATATATATAAATTAGMMMTTGMMMTGTGSSGSGGTNNTTIRHSLLQ
jgi:hypothetical protein